MGEKDERRGRNLHGGGGGSKGGTTENAGLKSILSPVI